MSKSIIRLAKEDDASELLEIYAPYVLNTAISFEYDVPTIDEFKNRINNTLKRYPYLVAIRDGQIVGYSYAGAFKVRKAYEHSVETTLYVRQDMRRKGIGRELYNELENVLIKQNVFNMNACIGCPATEDKYLTKDSLRFHERIGYKLVGEFNRCGYKFDRWYNMVWMEKLIGEHVENPKPFRSFNQDFVNNKKTDIT